MVGHWKKGSLPQNISLWGDAGLKPCATVIAIAMNGYRTYTIPTFPHWQNSLSFPVFFPFLLPANEVWGYVMFLHLSVILFTGGVCIPACNGPDTPLGQATPLGRHPPPGRHHPPPPRRPLQWTVRILLEYIHSCDWYFLSLNSGKTFWENSIGNPF